MGILTELASGLPPKKREPVFRPLYETEFFYVEFTNFRDPVIEDQVTGYGIINKAMGVREAECRRFDVAVALARAYDTAHRDLVKEMAAAEIPLWSMPAANERAC